MTENEAIEVLKDFGKQVSAKADGAYQSTIGEKACNVAINALEEVQQYRAIGTPEECRAAEKKQKAKKMESPWCPCCGKFLTTEYMNKRYHCIYCGQLLEWEGER